jgi:hypothetical protein
MVKDFLKFNNFSKRCLAGIFGALIFMLVLYGYFIDRAVMNIAERKNVEQEIAMLHTELSNLEMEYSVLQNKITQETALALGLEDSGEVTFVVKSRTDSLLSVNDAF